MKQKGIAPIFIVIAVAILAAGGYLIYKLPRTAVPTPTPPVVLTPSPTPQPIPVDTTNWRVLVNNRYKYTLRYPANFKVIGVGIDPVDVTTAERVVIFSDLGQTKTYSPTILIDASEKSNLGYKNMTLKEISQANFDSNKANKYDTSKIISGLESVIFAEEEAFTYAIESSGFSGKWVGFQAYEGINKIIEVEHKGIYYLIFYPKDKTFDQILSTFKFLP